MRTLLLCLLFLLHALPLRAMEFRVLSWDGTISGLDYDGAAGRPVGIYAEECVLSSPYRFDRADAPLVLYREETRDGHPVRVAAATLPLPAGMARAILVLAPADASRQSYLGTWVDDSLAARPANAIQFLNFSRKAVAVQAEGKRWLIPVQGAQVVPFDTTARSLPLAIAAQARAGWEVVSTNRQPVRAGFRILVLLRDGRRQGDGTLRPVDLMTVYDRAPLAPES